MDSTETNISLKACVLGSGSKGNATWISDGEKAILVDAGMSGIEIQRRLDSRGLAAEDLAGILVTHEHTDHTKGVGILSRRFDIPVYMNRKTHAAAQKSLGRIEDLRFFECGKKFSLNGFSVHPFSISHDAVDPSGFTVEKNGAKVGVATDLGFACLVVRDRLKGCGVLVIESNHDPKLLMSNPNYPWALKQRVKSRKGHLSNAETCALILELRHDDLRHVVLAHLSEENNCPDLAFNMACETLEGHGAKVHVATQGEASDVLFL